MVPGATCAGKSSLSGAGTDRAVAWQLAYTTLTAVDCYGNTQTSGGDPWLVTLTKPGVPSVTAAVADPGTGRYVATYNATVAGEWLLHVPSMSRFSNVQ